MPSFFISYEDSRFHAIAAGSGEELLICLHGFGESAAGFERLARTLGHVFTIVALDLPLHGQTEWKQQRPFAPQDLEAVLRLVLDRYGQRVFSLMGYSMGGRAALCAVQQMAARIKRLYLLAADGLKNNPWHLFVTQTAAGNRLFRYVTYHPQLFFRLLTLWRKLGRLNESVYKFAFYSMDTLEKRERVYHVWTCMRLMMPDRARCKRLIAQHNIQTLLIFGKYDRIIPPVLGVRFMDGSFPCKMLVMNRGHQLISDELGELVGDHL